MREEEERLMRLEKNNGGKEISQNMVYGRYQKIQGAF